MITKSVSKRIPFLAFLCVLGLITLEAQQIDVVDTDIISIALEWTPNGEFPDIQILERRKMGEANFKTIVRFPHKADRFKDLGLESDATYEYRLTLQKPTGLGQPISVKAKTLPNPHTQIFNVRDFGAVGDGTTNNAHAIRNAIEAAGQAGGGIIYFPEGVYGVAPDPEPRHHIDGHIFPVEYSNLSFIGEGPEKSIISSYSSGMRDPETNWDIGSETGTLVRPTCFTIARKTQNPVKNIVFRGLRVTGNTRPTGNTGWYNNEQKETGWDTTHKGLLLGANNDNILVDNCIWDGFRGEIIYSGAPTNKKVKIMNSKIYGTNSSAISTSADFECDNIEIWDAANSCVESAFFNNLNGNSYSIQNGIFRNSRFQARGTMLSDPIANPILENSKSSGRHGLAIFNTEDTYMVVDGCTIETSAANGLFLDVAQRNFLVIDNEFIDSGTQGYINFKTKNKEDYQLIGGLSNILIQDNLFWSKSSGGIFINTAIGGFDVDQLLIKNNSFKVTGGACIVLNDGYPAQGNRNGFILSNNSLEVSKPGKITRLITDKHWNSSPSPKPLIINNDFPIPEGYESGDGLISLPINPGVPTVITIHGTYKKIHRLEENSDSVFTLNGFLDLYPDGFNTTILRSHDEGTALIPSDKSWNSFPFDLRLDLIGDTLEIQKTNGKFAVKSYLGNNALIFDENNQLSINESTNAGSYSMFSASDEGEVYKLQINTPNVELINSDYLELKTESSFISGNELVEFLFTKIGDKLVELDRAACQRYLVSR